MKTALAGVAGATEWTFNVASGDTKTVDEIVTASQSTGSPITLKNGDTIKKNGGGTLKSSTAVTSVALNYNITEGVYYAVNGNKHPTGNPSTLKIAADATLNIQGSTSDVFTGKWNVSFEGTGVGTGDNLDAICVGGADVNNKLGTGNGTLTMTGDATIYSYGQYNWLKTGEENAAANSAALPTLVSKVDDSTTVYFPPGDYYFDGDCDLSSVSKDGVMLWNPDTNAVLHTSLFIGAAKNVVVDGLAFGGLEGPAIIATGTEGLAIANCRLDGVAGTYEGGHYPFAAVNVTDFDLRDFARVFTDFTWDAQAYFDGGKQLAIGPCPGCVIFIR